MSASRTQAENFCQLDACWKALLPADFERALDIGVGECRGANEQGCEEDKAMGAAA
ncbi:hypothetical protein DB31_0497 [Hyalangium minutum]|uniref:Uncharacterized protein n=1 Tax=Hyalangium minutum TaxID=394096 RepID=A0A085WX22_9BACT|nr:hypothetical protein DB31_0497 [Hyalangium minutum]